MLAITASFIGKDVLNFLAGVNPNDGDRAYLLILLIELSGIALVRATIQKAIQYCQAMHNDVLNGKIALIKPDFIEDGLLFNPQNYPVLKHHLFFNCIGEINKIENLSDSNNACNDLVYLPKHNAHYNLQYIID